VSRLLGCSSVSPLQPWDGCWDPHLTNLLFFTSPSHCPSLKRLKPCEEAPDAIYFFPSPLTFLFSLKLDVLFRGPKLINLFPQCMCVHTYTYTHKHTQQQRPGTENQEGLCCSLSLSSSCRVCPSTISGYNIVHAIPRFCISFSYSFWMHNTEETNYFAISANVAYGQYSVLVWMPGVEQ